MDNFEEEEITVEEITKRLNKANEELMSSIARRGYQPREIRKTYLDFVNLVFEGEWSKGTINVGENDSFSDFRFHFKFFNENDESIVFCFDSDSDGKEVQVEKDGEVWLRKETENFLCLSDILSAINDNYSDKHRLSFIY